MPEPGLRVPGSIRDFFPTLHPQIKSRVRGALDDIARDPACGKPLEAELSGLWTLRIGSYRVIYRRDKDMPSIVAIGPRETIYEETARLILRNRRQP
jgi:mRNA-degrading endonuclease RelE of RelBE toxin-antitoxin system